MKHFAYISLFFSCIVLFSCGDTNGDNPLSQEELKAKAKDVLDPPDTKNEQSVEAFTVDSLTNAAQDSLQSE